MYDPKSMNGRGIHRRRRDLAKPSPMRNRTRTTVPLHRRASSTKPATAQGAYPPGGLRAAGLRGSRTKLQKIYDLANGDQAEILRQPHRDVRAAVSVQLLRQRLRLLPVSPQKQAHRPQEAHPGGSRPGGHRPAGHGAQASGHRSRRGPGQQPHRIHPRMHQHHLFHQAQKRRDPPGQRQHRRHHGGKLPQAQGGRHRHLYPVPGDLPQGELRKAASRPAPSTITPTTPRPWTAPWRAASTTWACGVLFGLELYRYEFAGLLMHAEHLEAVHGVGPHTISVPRIKHADDIDPDAFDNGISDEIFAKDRARCIRIAVPYTGMIISTRESQAVREKVLHLGVSQISGGIPHQSWAAMRAGAGGRKFRPVRRQRQPHPGRGGPLADGAGIHSQLLHRLLPRRAHRRPLHAPGARRGQIANCCHPNALMTLKEYLEDYASADTRAKG